MLSARLTQRLRTRWWARRTSPAGKPLRHQRLFVLPTRFGLGWALLIGVLMLLGINYQNSLVYGLAFWLFAVAGVVVLRTWRNLLGVTVRIQPLGEAFAGETLRLRVSLQAARPRVAITARLGTLVGQSDIEAGDAQLLLELPVTQRGRLTLPPLRVTTEWPLGLIRIVAWVDSGASLLIYPRPLQGDTTQDRPRGTGGEALDFAGLRRYQPGDSLTQLAWKQWSRTGTLQTKHFNLPALQTLWLDYATCRGDVETRLSTLCAQVLAHHEADDAFGLRLPGMELPIARGGAQRRRALEALACWPSTGTQPSSTPGQRGAP